MPINRFPITNILEIPARDHGDLTGLSDDDHSALYAPVAEGVTNGDSHNHEGGDGASITEGALALSDVVTLDASTSKHGFVPKLPNDATKFLNGLGAFAVPDGGGATVAVKASDQIINNSASLTADDDLYFAIGANEIWAFHFVMRYRCSNTTPDLRHLLNCPSGATKAYDYIGLDRSDTFIFVSSSGVVRESRVNGATYGETAHYIGVVTNGVNAGNVWLSWAQWTATAVDTIMMKGSYVVAHKLN
ncbi:MAG: hypothetical protein ACRKGH_03745 [Dehalogenimonas sp.]